MTAYQLPSLPPPTGGEFAALSVEHHNVLARRTDAQTVEIRGTGMIPSWHFECLEAPDGWRYRYWDPALFGPGSGKIPKWSPVHVVHGTFLDQCLRCFLREELAPSPTTLDALLTDILRPEPR